MSKYPLIGLLLAAIASGSSAALPPKYLAVKDFKRCLAVQQFATYRAWCMPTAQPESCPAASWAELIALTGNDRIPACPATAASTTPPAQAKPGGR
jgi:hypothetical protein